MNNKSLIKYKETFFKKVKKIILNIFFKEKCEQENIQKHDSRDIENSKNYFNKYLEIDKTKIESDKIKIDILTTIEEKPELLNIISIDKLKKIIELYDEIIEKNNEKINNLGKKVI